LEKVVLNARPGVRIARRGTIPVTIYSIGRTRKKKKKDATALEAFFSLAFPLSSLSLSL